MGEGRRSRLRAWLALDGVAKLRAVLVENFPLKLLALSLAVGLVWAKRREQVSETRIDLRVQVTYPSDQVLVSPVRHQVKVDVRGPYKAVKALRPSSVPPLEVVLFGFEEQQYSFDAAAVKLPPELKVVKIEPATMGIAFESKKQARVPIRVQTEGKLADGFRLVSVQVQPSEVMVSGAASAVEGLREVLTSPVVLDGRSRSVEVPVKLAPPPKFVSYLHGNQQYVAQLVVEEVRGTRTLPEQTIEVRGLAEGAPLYEVSPGTVDVTFEGPVRLLNELDARTLAPYVDVSKTAQRGVLKSQRVVLDPIPGLVTKTLEPTRVTLLPRKPPPPSDGAAPELDPVDAGAP